MDTLTRWRDEFPILARSVYMISNSLGAMPRGVDASLADYTTTWGSRGVRAWAERWWDMNREVAAAVAPIVGADATTLSLHENVTTAHAVVLSTLPPPGRRNRIVCTAGDFPSIVYRRERSWRWASRSPSSSRRRPHRESGASRCGHRRPARRWSRCHTPVQHSVILDPLPIIERATRSGAAGDARPLPVGGHRPRGLAALDVDFAAGGCLKWLCGGPGNAFLYTHPERQRTRAPSIPRLDGTSTSVRVLV